ncbi:MAG: GyrI-like domain-containing protein [Coriobacteriia bacterium]|nr:GyrI-like domain-containing protein [Coriobacteriia bacterium]
MPKLDYKKQLAHLYKPSPREVVEVNVPEMSFLMIEGQGDPTTSESYSNAVEALYAVAYALKFAIKKGPSAIDYGVMPLEALWWADDMSAFVSGDRSAWQWTAMIMQPDPVTTELVETVLADVSKKKNPPALPLMRFATFEEGLAAQTMHVGPFSAEGPTIERVHDFISASGRTRFGKHHEIYLSDIRKADPAKWQTVIRQPMRSVPRDAA